MSMINKLLAQGYRHIGHSTAMRLVLKGYARYEVVDGFRDISRCHNREIPPEYVCHLIVRSTAANLYVVKTDDIAVANGTVKRSVINTLAGCPAGETFTLSCGCISQRLTDAEIEEICSKEYRVKFASVHCIDER